jgi:stress response protein YsnF
MSEPSPITTLADFHTAWDERAELLIAQRERQRADLAAAEEAIEALQRELAGALQRRDEVIAAREQTRLAQQALPAERDAAERELIRSTLLAGIESVEAAQRRRGRIRGVFALPPQNRNQPLPCKKAAGK